MSLKSFLKERRHECAITQTEAAERIGDLRCQFTSQIELGKSKAPITVLKGMCRVYNISSAEMLEQYVEDMVLSARLEAERLWYACP